MAHDFAKQRAARVNRAAKPPAAPWLWLASGIAIGTLISFLVYLATLAPSPQQGPAPAPAQADKPPPAVTATAKKATKPPANRPEFDFYDILRSTEGGTSTGTRDEVKTDAPAPEPKSAAAVEVPEPAPPTASIKPATAATPPAAAAADAPKPAALSIQAGAFRQRAEADRRRGEIILLGYEARIESLTAGGETRYRVTVGPFADPQSQASARRALRDVGIETL